MKNGNNGVILDLESNSKPYLFKRMIADGFDTVAVFLLFMLFSALIFASPLASTYNAHYENYKKVQEEVKAEYGDDAAAMTEKLRGDAYYRDEQFAANLHSYILKLLAGFLAEAAVLLAVPLISPVRGTPGKLMTGIMPFSEKRQTKATRGSIVLRFVFVYLIDSAFFYLFTGIYTFILIPVMRFVEIIVNKKNKTVLDALSGVMIIERLSYNGIDK